MRPTALLPLRRKANWGFFRPKNPTALAGFEPPNMGTKGQHATSRPPKPLRLKYWRTPRSSILLEKATGRRLVRKFCAFYGTRTFIITFTTARHPSLSWARSIQSMSLNTLLENPFQYDPPFLALVIQVVSFPQDSPPQPCMHPSSPPYVPYAPKFLVDTNINLLLIQFNYCRY